MPVVPNRKILWRFIAMFVLLCLIVLGIKTARYAMQPKYQGKTMEEWYAEVKSMDAIWVMNEEEFARDPATVALKQFGTNAVWFLWREHCRRDSQITAWYMERFDHPSAVYWFNHQQMREEITARLLMEFGSGAEVLIPEILAGLNTNDQRERERLVHLLGTIRKQPELVLPALVRGFPAQSKAMHDHFRDIRTIGEFGPAAKAYVPELKARLANPMNQNRGLQATLAETIVRINGPGPELQILLRELRPGDASLCHSGMGPFENVGTNALPVVPELLRFAQTFTNSAASNYVISVIRKIDVEGVHLKP
ncbi:MAG TPA: hypothetical protein VGH19_22060 [Verrucomicrobiae bacterium]